MKKIILTVAAVFAFGFANAQDGAFKLGAHVGIPMGDIKDASSLNYGLDAAYVWSVADKFKAGVTTGYDVFSGKDGIDDITGEPLTHRKDDRLEVIEQRLENYRNLTFPIIEYLKEKEIEVIVIDGTMPLSEQVNLVNSHLPSTSKKFKM